MYYIIIIKLVENMHIKWWVKILILSATAVLIGACARATTPPAPTPAPLPVVQTDVAATLTAIAPTPSATASLTPTTAATPTLVATATPTASPTPAASATPPASPTPTLTPTATPASPTVVVPNTAGATPTAAAEETCIDKAGFFGDVTIPDNTLLQKDAEFIKTWRIRNVGTCTWGDGYNLVFANGHIMDGPPTSPLPKAAPGDIINISVNMKAPSDGGTYAGDWEFENPAGQRFGVNSHGEDLIWVIIKVDWGPGVGPTPTPPPVNCAYTTNPDYVTQLLALINAKRAENQRAPLTLQSNLSAAAAAHSADMACHSYLDHVGSDKSTYLTRIQAANYKFTYASENIYAGGDAQEAFDWWMGSPIHKANILDPKVTQIGIAYAYYSQSAYGGYYTLDFAHP